jgi:hypothetical protein
VRVPADQVWPLRVSSPAMRRAALTLLAVLAALPLAADAYPYLPVLGIDILIAVLFAASLHLIMGPGGMHSFGHAAYFGLGAYGAALALKALGLPMLLALVLALAVQWRQTRGEVVRGFLAILVGAVVGAPFVHTPRIDHALLATAIAAEGANVKVMLLGASLPSAHPAAQMAGAQWVSRLPAAWALEAHRRLDGSGPSQQAQVERDRHAAATRAICPVRSCKASASTMLRIH